MLKQLKGWIVEDGKLVKLYPFTNYYQTMAFVNALAWISHREDHHPDLAVGYNQCRVDVLRRTRSAGCRRTTSSAPPSATRCLICSATLKRVFSSFDLRRGASRAQPARGRRASAP